MIDRLEALERLARLRDGGVLTPDEFEGEKARIIAGDTGLGVKGTHEDVVLRPARDWKAVFYRNRWVLGGAAAATLVGASLAFAVLGDIRSVARPTESNRPVIPAKPVASLGAALRFRDPATCTPSEGLQDLLQSMTDLRKAGSPTPDVAVRVAGFEEALVPVVAKSGDSEGAPTIVEVAIPGTWQGLHVTRLHTATWGPDEVSTLQIHFREPPEQALTLLKQIGFPMKRVGELTQAGDSMVGVEAITGGSALTCARDARTGTRKPSLKTDDPA